MSDRVKSWLVFGLLLGTAAYGVAEEITVSTFYPSPRGVYNELRPVGTAVFATQGGSVGIRTDTPASATALDVNGPVRVTDVIAAVDVSCPDCLGAGDIGSNAVQADEIADGAVRTEELRDDTITTRRRS